MAPPMLIYPTDGDTIIELFPTFSWSLANPVLVNSDTKYSIKIVEIVSNQSPVAAIQANPEWYAQSNATTNIFSYPVSAPLFKQNKSYAWQVSAVFDEVITNGEAVSSKPRTIESEVFTFVLHDDMSDEECIPFLYERLDSRFYVFNDYQLKFKFRENADLSTLEMNYQIVDNRGKSIVNQPVFPSKSDNNDYYIINLQAFDAFRKKSNKGKFYFLEARSSEGRIYKLKFACS